MDRRGGRGVLARLGWNAVWLFVGLALIAAAGEAWRRAVTPFTESDNAPRFVPGVGRHPTPHTRIRHTNLLDFWTEARTNRLGFLDREPPDAERAAESCHVAIIGDSFVQAKQVPIADKVQVRLEESAARRLPELDLTASAYGLGGTGQVNQLPFYDEYARRLRPKLVVLAFVLNDYVDNFGVLRALLLGYHPERYPRVAAVKNRQGTIELRPPSADYSTDRLPMQPWRTRWVLPARTLGFPRDLYVGDMLDGWLDEAADVSYFINWLGLIRFRTYVHPIEYLQTHFPGEYGHWLDDWSWLRDAPPSSGVPRLYLRAELPRFLDRALDYTAFALDQFKRRSERDGFRLAILSTHVMGTEGDPSFDRMHGMAEARGIPVIDQYDYIVRQGGRIEDAHWAHDNHWTPTGHRWAAEALLEWIEGNRDVCRPGGEAPRGGP